MAHPVIAIESDRASEIHARLKAEKKFTGKSIRRIVTDILMRRDVFVCPDHRENREKQPQQEEK